ncbi:MAG: reverse transcriptase domain-containing protein, partial [Patulibacter sp.]
MLQDARPSTGIQSVLSVDALSCAADQVIARGGAAGPDGETTAAFATRRDEAIPALHAALTTGVFRAGPLLAAPLHRPGRAPRTLLIPNVIDRVVQRALLEQLSAAAETLLHPGSFGYRPGRSTLTAVDAVRSAIAEKPFVLDADISDFFGSVRHDIAVAAVGLIGGPRVAELVAGQLAAPVFGDIEPRSCGLPLGGPLWPLVANLVLDPLDRALTAIPGVELVRFADDFVVLAPSAELAREAHAVAARELATLGLALHPAKTRLLDARRDPFAFLGQAIVPGTHPAAPRKPTARMVYLTRDGTAVRARGNRIVIVHEGDPPLAIRVAEVAQVVVSGRCEFSSAALALLLSHGIDVVFVAGAGRCWGALRTWRSSTPATTLQQLQAAGDPELSLALGRAMIDGKVRNQR